ncbi:hypothetical protein BDW75DRAFT_208953 [Aspergillus navahoensis]
MLSIEIRDQDPPLLLAHERQDQSPIPIAMLLALKRREETRNRLGLLRYTAITICFFTLSNWSR